MSSFPLYENFMKQLDENCKVEDLSSEQKGIFIKNIKIIDKKGSELIYALIRTYQMDNKLNLSNIPYNGIKKKDNIKFDLENFPYELKHLLYKFVNIHMEAMKEEIGRLDQGI